MLEFYLRLDKSLDLGLLLALENIQFDPDLVELSLLQIGFKLDNLFDLLWLFLSL